MVDQAPDPKVDPRTFAEPPPVDDDQLEGVLRQATQMLKDAGIPAARGDARALIAHVLDLNRSDLYLQGARRLSDAEIEAIFPLVERRADREPVARIIGEREFWGLPFGLSPATLEPRPDSELVIEAVLAAITVDGVLPVDRPFRIADFGTGTGCLLLALLNELPAATGIALDLSEDALIQAEENARHLGLDERVEFLLSDWDEALDEDEAFDIIVSNPPYIAGDVIEQLAPEVRDHDPELALDGGEDGLDAYRALAPVIRAHLADDGLAALEIGFDQGKSVPAIMTAAGLRADPPLTDLAQHPRCVLVRQPKTP